MSQETDWIDRLKRVDQEAAERLKEQLKRHLPPPVIVYSPPPPPSIQPAQIPSQPMKGGKVIEAGH